MDHLIVKTQVDSSKTCVFKTIFGMIPALSVYIQKSNEF